MRFIVLAVTGYLLFVKIISGEDFLVTRNADGDIFTAEGSCTAACTVLSSGTASPYYENLTKVIYDVEATSCICQCNPGSPIFRDDLQICVDDIHECNAAGFASESGLVEKVPYVVLPSKNQIIYPQAEIKFEGVKTPVCGITGSQQLGKGGWFELKNLTSAQPPFRLIRDDGKTFLQWTGETELRSESEGKIVVTKLVCRDAYPDSSYTGVFAPCVAFRIAGSSSKNSIREVIFSSNTRATEGLSATEYTAIGLSSILLALIYVASVSLYLQSKRNRRKSVQEEPEVPFPDGRIGGMGLVKNNLLLAANRHFDNDNNSGPSESDTGDELPQNDGEQRFENVTSAIVHPNVSANTEPTENLCGSGPLLGERLPEENVRIVETMENQMQQHETPVLPGNQRRKLYFNPAYFDRQLLLAPPPAAVEFLLKIREVIAIAKHKMSAKRFVPTLFGIPEEDNTSESASNKKGRSPVHASTRNTSIVSISPSKKSQNCSGCPGCTESSFVVPPLPENSRPIPGESRVRAWLEDVKPLDRNWKDSNVNQKTTRSLEYLKELRKYELSDSKVLNSKMAPQWIDTPLRLHTFRNVARSEILGNDDRHSISQRSSKSVIEDSKYYIDQRARRKHFYDCSSIEQIAANIKIRQAIEKSFIQQMEETAKLEQKKEELKNSINLGPKLPNEVEPDDKVIIKKSISPKKDLPDMINELPQTTNPKRIMDAVIREMVVSKSIDHNETDLNKTLDYEVDSLERTKQNQRKISCSSSQSNNETGSSTMSTALPMDEEMTMRNAVINARTGEMTTSNLKRNCSKIQSNLPELIQKTENYSLVSEVYVNDGYASPGSDDSGPEIQYEPENPGHLMIKVHDSPNNYIRQDESEYEPDTLDRKPTKLKVNGSVHERALTGSETYVDSLERPGQILLRSKGSFKDETNPGPKLKRGLGSLREIYEARMKKQYESSVNGKASLIQITNEDSDSGRSWQKTKYLTPESRHVRRQRKPQSRPDVVPPPPCPENIYQRPKPPRRVENIEHLAKNDADRSAVKAGHPTTADDAPVQSGGNPFSCVGSETWTKDRERCPKDARDRTRLPVTSSPSLKSLDSNFYFLPQHDFRPQSGIKTLRSTSRVSSRNSSSLSNRCPRHSSLASSLLKIDDSGYLSSADSSESQRQLLKSDATEGSFSETDESICDGASESGAESVGTDSVFFGNFRKLSEASRFSKSTDSGVDVDLMTTYGTSGNLKNDLFPVSNLFNASDSETESFVTVLAPNASRRNSLVMLE